MAHRIEDRSNVRHYAARPTQIPSWIDPARAEPNWCFCTWCNACIAELPSANVQDDCSIAHGLCERCFIRLEGRTHPWSL